MAQFVSQGNLFSIPEKPALPKSNFAVFGLYPNRQMVDVARTIRQSVQGEFGVIDVYLE